MEEAYTTVWAEARATFTEKKSRFIGHIAPVQNEGEALTYLNSLRTKYWDANHNVYAYITREGNITRCSDDGEPQGTGGVPVLGVLQKEGLTDVIAVVTRYFGGTLLGVGGLVRAYSHGAKLALDAAEKKEMLFAKTVEISLDYTLYGKVNNLLPDFQVQMVDSRFAENVVLTFQVRPQQEAALFKTLQEISSGQIKPEILTENFVSFRL